jgi:cation diffusion facilitator family transporter
MQNDMATARGLAGLSVLASGGLAVANIVAGVLSRSTSVLAAGVEFAGDVFASAVVFTGMMVAARPADANHPYGHGRYELLAALVVGLVVTAGGAGICIKSLQDLESMHPPPGFAGVWTLGIAVCLKTGLAWAKFRVGRNVRSASLVADAWNDAIDIISAAAALVAVVLTISDPARFAAADHYGGFIVGIIVIATGLRIIREVSLDLTDAAAPAAVLAEIRSAALEVPGVLGVEKCFARKTGLQYHVDLHIGVDPEMSVIASHDVASDVRKSLRQRVAFVADVLVHVEPHVFE